MDKGTSFLSHPPLVEKSFPSKGSKSSLTSIPTRQIPLEISPSTPAEHFDMSTSLPSTFILVPPVVQTKVNLSPTLVSRAVPPKPPDPPSHSSSIPVLPNIQPSSTPNPFPSSTHGQPSMASQPICFISTAVALPDSSIEQQSTISPDGILEGDCPHRRGRSLPSTDRRYCEILNVARSRSPRPRRGAHPSTTIDCSTANKLQLADNHSSYSS